MVRQLKRALTLVEHPAVVLSSLNRHNRVTDGTQHPLGPLDIPDMALLLIPINLHRLPRSSNHLSNMSIQQLLTEELPEPHREHLSKCLLATVLSPRAGILAISPRLHTRSRDQHHTQFSSS
jgi:hypothetical protein